jgi:hypothetical protein
MIKKLRNQPYAPKSGASSQMGAKRKKKIYSEKKMAYVYVVALKFAFVNGVYVLFT